MRIDYYNRDGQKIWLEQVGEGEWWQLRFGQPSLFDYTRLLFEDEGDEIYAVDPPGGPFIALDSVVRLGQKQMRVMEIKRTSLGIFLRLG